MTTRYDRMRRAAHLIQSGCIADSPADELAQQLRADADELEREIEALRRDAARLDWLVSRGYWFGGSRDGERVWLMRLVYANDESDALAIEQFGKSYCDAREAIDAAIVNTGCNCDVPKHAADCLLAALAANGEKGT